MNSNVKLPLTLAEVLYEEIRADVESNPELAVLKQQVEDGLKKITDYQGCACDSPQDVWAGRSKLSADLVHEIYGLIRPLKRAALCLSGGGVRSATFNFGILQGLARCRLLNKFEYLSTVSGGGFIGSWLTAWIYREQQKHVADVDDRREQGQPAQIDRNYGLRQVMALLRTQPWNTPLKPEPDPVFNLRVYSNYLTPKKGLLSPDSSTLVAVYLRNLLLNWLVFVPAIMCFLMLPRIWLALVRSAFNAHPGSGQFDNHSVELTERRKW